MNNVSEFDKVQHTDFQIFVEPHNDVKGKKTFELIQKNLQLYSLLTIRYATCYTFYKVPKQQHSHISQAIQLYQPFSYIYESVDSILEHEETIKILDTHKKNQSVTPLFFDYIAYEVKEHLLDCRIKSLFYCLNMLKTPYPQISIADVFFLYTADLELKQTHNFTNAISEDEYKSVVDMLVDNNTHKIINLETLPTKNESYETKIQTNPLQKPIVPDVLSNFNAMSYQDFLSFLAQHSFSIPEKLVYNIYNIFKQNNKTPNLLDLEIFAAVNKIQQQTDLLDSEIADVQFTGIEDEAIQTAWEEFCKNYYKNKSQPIHIRDIMPIYVSELQDFSKPAHVNTHLVKREQLSVQLNFTYLLCTKEFEWWGETILKNALQSYLSPPLFSTTLHGLELNKVTMLFSWGCTTVDTQDREIKAGDVFVLLGSGDFSQLSQSTVEEKVVMQKFFSRKSVQNIIKRCLSLSTTNIVETLLPFSSNHGLDIILDDFLSHKVIKNKDYSSLFLCSHNYVLVGLSSENMLLLKKQAEKYGLSLILLAHIIDTAVIRVQNKGEVFANLQKEWLNIKQETKSLNIQISPPSHIYALSSPWHNSIFTNGSTFDGRVKNIVEAAVKTFFKTSEKQSYTKNSPSDAKNLQVFENNTTLITNISSTPTLLSQSVFHGSVYTILDCLNKATCKGVDLRTSCVSNHLVLEENDTQHVFSASLAAYSVQEALNIPIQTNVYIQNKNLLSTKNSHNNVTSLVSITNGLCNIAHTKSSHISEKNLLIYVFVHTPLSDGSPNYLQLNKIWKYISQNSSQIVNIKDVEDKSFIHTLTSMCVKNHMGAVINFSEDIFYTAGYGSFVITTRVNINPFDECVFLGRSVLKHLLTYRVHGSNKLTKISLQNFHQQPSTTVKQIENKTQSRFPEKKKKNVGVCIPHFLNYNCDEFLTQPCTELGANCSDVEFISNTVESAEKSLLHLEKSILTNKILILGNYYIQTFNNRTYTNTFESFLSFLLCEAKIVSAMSDLLHRGGLILGMGSSFVALLKSGWLPFNRVKKNHLSLPRTKISFEENEIFIEEPPTKNSVSLKYIQYKNTHVSPWLSLCEESKDYISYIQASTTKLSVGRDVQEVKKNLVSTYKETNNNYIEALVGAEGKILGKLGSLGEYIPHITENWKERPYSKPVDYLFILEAGMRHCS